MQQSEALALFGRPAGSRPWVLGHRGARHAAPENTFSAFELARNEGADGVELDVRLDADGRVVVAHDKRLGRVSHGASNALVEELPTSVLRSFDLGAGERVPLLAEVLEWARDHALRVNVELKSDLRRKRALLEGVVAQLKADRAAAKWVLLSSFHPRFVRYLAARLPEVPVCWLVHDRQVLLRFAPGWRSLGAHGVNPQHTLLSAGNVARWKAAGALVNTWTVNEPQQALQYAELGVDCIISDTPAHVLSAFAEPRTTSA